MSFRSNCQLVSYRSITSERQHLLVPIFCQFLFYQSLHSLCTLLLTNLFYNKNLIVDKSYREFQFVQRHEWVLSSPPYYLLMELYVKCKYIIPKAVDNFRVLHTDYDLEFRVSLSLSLPLFLLRPVLPTG